MTRTDYAKDREIFIAKAISEVVAELRLVDLADYLAFLRFEQYNAIADLVDSAAELYFMPGALRLGNGGEASVAWGEVPKIKLDLELRLRGATVFFTLSLEDEQAGVSVSHIAFNVPRVDEAENTTLLFAMIEDAQIRRKPAEKKISAA